MKQLSLPTFRKKAKFLIWLLVLNTSSGVLLLAEQEQQFITCHDQKLTQENDLTPNDILSILESEDTLVCLGKIGQELFLSLYNHPTKNQYSVLLQKCYKRIFDGYTTLSYKDLLNVIEEIYAILATQENKKNLMYLQELVQVTKPCAVTFSSDGPELLCKNGQRAEKSNTYYELYLAPDAHIAPTLDITYQTGDTEIKTIMTVYTAGIAPSSISSININAKNLFVSSQAGVTPKTERGVFVSPGTTLLNNIGPWKIANPDGTTPLSDGTKILNVSNFFFDPTGTTEFGGNVLIDGNLTVDGSTIFGSNNYTFSSDVFIDPNATLFVSEIDPRSPGTTTTMSGNVNVNQNLVVDGNLTVNGSSNIGGGANYTFSSDVFIDNNATLFVSEIDPRSPSTTTGFSGNVNMAQNLIVTGATTLVGNTIEHGTLSVTGSTSLIGAVGLASTLNVAGATTLNSLAVTNNETVGGNVHVAGATTLVGNTIEHGTLSVTGSTSLIGAVGLASTLNVAGATTLNSLAVTNNETVGGNVHVAGATTLVGNTIEHGTLSVTGSTSLIGAVGLASTLNVAGATTLNSLTV